MVGRHGVDKTFAEGVERGGAAVDEPLLYRHVTIDGVEQHLLVIAEDTDQLRLLAEGEELLDDATARGAAVDRVAKHDDRIVLADLEAVDKGLQRGATAVDVADGQNARGGSHDEWLHGDARKESGNPCRRGFVN
jgi:hypothetical protein